MSKGLQRIFLDWNRPLLEQAGEMLMAMAPESGVLDLSDTLVVVPTSNAARRLREMLANLAAERGTAVIPPLCGPPTLLVRPEDGAARIGRPLASTAEIWAAWISVLRNLQASDFPQLFPITPEVQDFAWAQGMAGDLIEVRSILGEAGLLMADVAKRLPAEHDEKDRWQDMARIEEQFLALLRELERCDPVAARALPAEKAVLREGTRRVMVIGTADPFPLARKALESLVANATEVTVVVYAPEDRAEGFDEWGQPLADYWTSANAPIRIDDFSSCVSVMANPDHLNETVVETVKACAAPEETLAIGALDSKEASIMERALRDRGFAGFAPEGRMLRTEGVVHFLELWRDFIARPRPTVAADLLRTPEIGAWLATQIEDWRQATALRGVDDGLANHLVEDAGRLAEFLRSDAEAALTGERPSEHRALRYQMAASALEKLIAMRSRVSAGQLSVVLPEVLREILSCRVVAVGADGARPGAAEIWPEKVLETTGPVLLQHLGELSAVAANAGVKLSDSEQLTLAIRLLSQVRLSAERPPAALELQGWLELLWEDAPHLVVAGLNDGIAPEAVVGHPFLPESLRSLDVLGLKGNAERFARDCYQLMALVESRRETGRVDILLVRRSQGGDPMRPSRLLLCCQDEELPARVQHLFREVEVSGTRSSWDAGFRLVPNAPREGGDDDESENAFGKRPLDRLSVTGFRRYLESPFHFYLDRMLRAETVEPVRSEMNAMEFGNFCHQVLENFGRDEVTRDLHDESAIEDFLMNEAEKLATKWFGNSPALAVRVQLHAARQRLQAVARVQALERQAGWQIIDAELDIADVGKLVIDGVTVSGRIDRIEQRDGVTRVLDYKTSDKAKTPRENHWKGIIGGVEYAHLPDYARFEIEERGKMKEKRWTDLQLPLYCLALREKYGGAIEAGYLMMPKAVSGTAVSALRLEEDVLAAARNCAEGIIADVKAEHFWPLVPQGEWDDYGGLHLGTPELTVDASFIGGKETGV